MRPSPSPFRPKHSERVKGLVLVYRATNAIALEGWAILLQHLAVAGILAAAAFLLALVIGLCASKLHIRLALQRRHSWRRTLFELLQFVPHLGQDGVI